MTQTGQPVFRDRLLFYTRCEGEGKAVLFFDENL